MSLIRHNNGNTTRSILSDFFDTEKFFSSNFDLSQELPAVNVIDNEKDYRIEIAAPGMKKDDFKVSVADGILNISAEREESSEEEKKNYTRREFSYRSFSRSFRLPENANEENVAAKYENGVLALTLTKKVAATPRKKEIAIA